MMVSPMAMKRMWTVAAGVRTNVVTALIANSTATAHLEFAVSQHWCVPRLFVTTVFTMGMNLMWIAGAAVVLVAQLVTVVDPVPIVHQACVMLERVWQRRVVMV